MDEKQSIGSDRSEVMIYELMDMKKVEPIFAGWEETLIFSCLQQVMGRVFVTDPNHPRAACAFVGCFAFYAGTPEKELVLMKTDGFVIMTPENEEWAHLIEECFPVAKKVTRYAIKKNTKFDKGRLLENVNRIPAGYEICKIDSEIYEQCICNPVTSDFVSAFESKEKYLKDGRGMVVLKDGKIVAGASSYTRYQQGIEIEVDTLESERRKYLATAVCSALILECLKEDLYPSWDAQNMNSVHLAEKLGYEFSHEYIAYEVAGDMRTEMEYKYETHLHTTEASACAHNSGAQMARAAKEAGYAGIIVTDHNWGGNTAVDRRLPWEDYVEQFCKGYENAKAEGDKIGLQVFFGWEAGFRGTEFLIYGLDKAWMLSHPQIWDADVKEQYRLVHEGGGIVVHAHPFREENYIPEIRLYPEYVDGVEVINATHSNPHSKSHNNPLYNDRALSYAREHDLAMTAGSDIHTTDLFGGGMVFSRKLADIHDFANAVLKREWIELTDGSSGFFPDHKSERE